MNKGQFDLLIAALTEIAESLDEIRRATNRIDNRLKEAQSQQQADGDDVSE